MIVAFRGGRHNRWCAQEHNNWRCNRNGIGQWERYQLVNAGGGQYAFKSLRNHRYCADENMHNRILCNRGHIGQWERFRIYQAGNGKVALRGGRNNRFCFDHGHAVRCDRGGYGHRQEQWEMKCVGHCNGRSAKPVKLVVNSVVAFRGGRHNRWCAQEHNTWRCNRNGIGQWEKYQVVNAGGGQYAFISLRNERYCADENHHNRILCNRGGIGQWEKFRVIQAGSGLVALRGGRNNRYCMDHGHTVSCNRNGYGHRQEKFYVKCVGNCNGQGLRQYRPKQHSIIGIRGGRHNRWCAQEHNNWRCNRNGVGQWERYQVFHVGHNQFGLKSMRNHRYCADENHHRRILCNRGHIGQWERFRAYKLPNGKVALRGGRNNRFCFDHGDRVNCNRGGYGHRQEQFHIQCVGRC